MAKGIILYINLLIKIRLESLRNKYSAKLITQLILL